MPYLQYCTKARFSGIIKGMGVLIQIVYAAGILMWLWTMFKINQGEPSYIQKGLNFTGLAVSLGLIGFCLESGAADAQIMLIAVQLQYVSRLLFSFRSEPAGLISLPCSGYL